ncbi:MAG: 3-hydroxyacyl-CoA dehydrogenase family protein [Deltaproteobacteria bacterium]|nr:3-hydroxyacyl-CoA dehydrogenase family protein [Deltaproteobacteria bacterium]
MTVSGIKKICVVGAGIMGHEIALCAALNGYNVVCTDVNPEAINKAKKFIDSYLPDRVARGKLSEEITRQAQANLSFTVNLKEAAGDADVVIEAIIEKLALKRKLFSELDTICPKHTILATNSSFIVSSKIAGATNRPDKVCNMHFFNPALVMKLVEVIRGPHVSEETLNAALELTRSLDKTPVLLKKEIYGFLVNRILSALIHEALFLYDMDVASFEDIDTAVKLGLGHTIGPFQLLDLTGIDLSYTIDMERYQETGDPVHKPSPSIVEKFMKKEWGRKTGKGFYEYQNKS